MRFLALFLCASLGPTGPLLPAQSGSVALLHADFHPGFSRDVEEKLEALGRFATVDRIDVRGATPALTTLVQYDAVLVWGRVPFASDAALGNRLADYVDLGGGVVVACKSNFRRVHTQLAGRWRGAYDVFPATGFSKGGAAGLGTRHEPTHPILDGVASFEGGVNSTRPRSGPRTTARRIASWNDGSTLVAVSNVHARRADLGFHPVSADAVFGNWKPTTDGAVLVANSLQYVIDGPEPILRVLDLPAGGTATFEFLWCTPLDVVDLGWSRTGSGPTPTAYGLVSLSPPIRVLGPFVTDAAGTARVQAPVPPGIGGLVVWFQGIDRATQTLTNGVAARVQ